MEAGTFNRTSAGASSGQTQARSGVSVAALICGVLGVISFVAIIAPLIFGPMAILFGAMGRRETAAKGMRGRGMATAGIVLGVLAVLLGGGFLALGVTG